ncbi:uncharacterized protein LOC126973484 [Leptidea sinapis]|uniref:uncharacterized protein LOC126973484 n=1 Tax=Leptidea sinapis TaxID=189913 RepID=UPI0021C3EDB4|nr:uncharacterized protein LOC126973484 [Leptidea sinapis]
MAGIKAEELIETVRMFPALYDQAQEQYRNSEYKDIMWKKVAKKLNVKGQEEECKKKWNGIRDSLRRARQKRKTKSGQAAISSNKYKFETILEFLIPHLAERKGIGNVPDEAEENNETQPTDDPQMQNLNNDINADINEYVSDGTAESESLLPPRTPSASRVSIDNRTPSAKRKRKLPHTEMKPGESASSQLMAYLLAEKEAEKKKKPSDNDEQHPVDVFLSGIAASLKSLDPLRLHSAKGKIFNIVQEYELEQLRENNNRKTAMVVTRNVSSDTTSFTLSEEEGSCLDGHLSSGVPQTSSSPAVNADTYTNVTFFQL